MPPEYAALIKRGDQVMTICGVAIVLYVRYQTGAVVYETTIGEFSREEIERR